jgi:hypothetical protein
MNIAEHIFLGILLVISGLLLRRHWRSPALFEQTRALIVSVDQLRDELEMERRKSLEYLKKIQEVLKERDDWRGFYQHQASQHANAQSYLLQCLETLAVQYKKATGKAAPVDTAAAELVKHFSAEHQAAIEAVEAGRKAPSTIPLQNASVGKT